MKYKCCFYFYWLARAWRPFMAFSKLVEGSYIGEAPGSMRAVVQAAQCKRLAGFDSATVPHEALPAKERVGTGGGGAVAAGQRMLMVGESGVLGGQTHLEDLEAVGAAQHTVADGWRLRHKVALLESERLALPLVDDFDPPPQAEDHLEVDPMEVDVVGHLASIRDPDV